MIFKAEMAHRKRLLHRRSRVHHPRRVNRSVPEAFAAEEGDHARVILGPE